MEALLTTVRRSLIGCGAGENGGRFFLRYKVSLLLPPGLPSELLSTQLAPFDMAFDAKRRLTFLVQIVFALHAGFAM